MKSTTQATLLNRLGDGNDLLAWDEFFARYWPVIYALARHRGCSDHTAEEVVQDVVLKIFERRDVFQYDREKGRFRDWLAVVVRNRIAERRRGPSERIRAQGDDLEEPAAENTPADQQWDTIFELSMLAAMLDVVRAEVTPETYMAFELLALQEMPVATVTRATGLSRASAYRARAKVFDRLRQLAGTYQKDGQLQIDIRQAMQLRPEAAVQRSLATGMEETMRSCQEMSRNE